LALLSFTKQPLALINALSKFTENSCGLIIVKDDHLQSFAVDELVESRDLAI
jgi:hypothetical protein